MRKQERISLKRPLLSPQILAALPYDWSGGRLLFFSCLRVVFIPLFVMCVYPASAPTLSHPAWPCLFSLLMGVTNGYFGSVPMIQAAGKVPPEQRELAGELFTSMGKSLHVERDDRSLKRHWKIFLSTFSLISGQKITHQTLNGLGDDRKWIK